jgi:RNA polymerase sigma-70 factor (ECF subfamily)
VAGSSGSSGSGSARARPKPPVPPPPAEAEDLKPAALGKASDEELMRRTQTGDKKAFELLYERYKQSVLSYLYRMLGNLEDVESIGQEVFLRAFRFAPTYRYPEKFSTWLFTITRNLALNWARRSSLRRSDDGENPQPR